MRFITSSKASEADSEQRNATVYLEQEGERLIDQISEAVRTVPWSITLLQLAWTAGPVTFIAIQGGSMLGFGTPAPLKNAIYFMSYTVIAGLIGLVTTIMYKAARRRRERVAHDNLTMVIDLLPDLVFTARDVHLANVDSDIRRYETGGLLLRKVDLGPAGIALAIEQLTGNARLGQAAAEIELYRRAGFTSRIQDIAAEVQPDVDAAVAMLTETAPMEVEIFRERMRGNAPRPEDGVPREVNFIERILSSMEEESLFLMSLRDAEDMFLLAFELISGRKLPVLNFEYRGRWGLAPTIDRLEMARNRYRMAQATVFSRIRALSDRLADPAVAAATTTFDAEAEFRACCTRMQRLLVRLDTWERNGIPDNERSQYRMTIEDVRVAVELAGSLETAYRQTVRAHVRLLRAQQQWQERASHRRRQPLRFGSSRRSGIRLVQRSIQLDDEAKLELAESLAKYFRSEHIITQADQVLIGRPGRERALGPEDVKRIAIQVGIAMEPFVGLSRPEVQRAVNATNASYFSGIEIGTSAATKAGWGVAMAAEIKTDLGPAAERLALTLSKMYDVNLDERGIRTLHERYGASVERLQTLAASSEDSATISLTHPQLQPRLQFDDHWHRVLENARRTLERHPVKK